MARGRKIRTRRRAAILAGSVAVIAGAVAFVPVISHHQALPSPVSTHIRVTVNPPGPRAPAGTIASGLVGTESWDLRIQSPKTRNCLVSGTGLSYFSCNAVVPTRPDAIVPAGARGPGGFTVTRM
jgi:hypothetical protein